MTPGPDGFAIGHVTERGIVALDTAPTWQGALRRANLHATMRHTRVLVSHAGNTFALLDPDQLWGDREREWFALDTATVMRHAPAAPGVYVLRSPAPVCVGDAENVRDRLLYHLRNAPQVTGVTPAQLEFTFEVVETRETRIERMAELVRWWGPPCDPTLA